jgi:hypothetical protein
MDVDRSTGFLVTQFCPPELRSTEHFLYGTEPRQYCPIHTIMEPEVDADALVTEASFEPSN